MCFGLHSLPASLFSKHGAAPHQVADIPTEPNTELELDLRGRKHINQQDNADGLYLMQNDTGSIYIAFTDPGEASVDAFRTFIEGRLPHDLIRDEYGHVAPIAQVSYDHLPTLQAQLWLQNFAEDAHLASDGMASDMQVDKCGPVVQHKLHDTAQLSEINVMTDRMLSVASHFTFIVGLLQSKYIFVHRKKPDRTCELPGCQIQTGTQLVAPTVLTLEPLIHWATVTLAADITLCCGRVQAFRRDGEKCSDPLWTHAIKKYTPQNAPSYCSGCLEMLMGNRVPIMESLDRSVSKSFTAVNAQPAHLAEVGGLRVANGGFEKHFKNDGYQTVVRVDELPASRNSLDGCTRASPLNLDGAYDVRPDEDLHNVFRSDGSATSYDKAPASHSDGNGAEGDSTGSATEASPFHSGQFTPEPSSDATPHNDIRSSPWATVNNSPSLPNSPPSGRINFNPYTQGTSSFGLEGTSNDRAEATLDNKNIVNSPFRPSARAFGREIDANAVLSPLKLYTSMSKDAKTTKEKTKDIRAFLSPGVKTPQHLEVANPPPEQDPEPTDTFTAYLAHAAKSPSPPPKPKSKSKSKAKPKTPPKSKKKSPTRPKHPPAQAAPSTGPFRAKLTPPPCPSSISPLTYAAHFSRTPPPSEIICACRKPATSGSIAQCSNPTCEFAWWHYECLDKSAKLSARHGRLVCGICRNEAHFKQAGGSMEELVRRECEVAFEGWEIVGGLEGVGGGVRPYGLGGGVEVGERSKGSSKGALGELAFFGYAEARPEVLVEAYENAHLYGGAEGEGYGYEEEYEAYDEDVDMDEAD